MNSQKIELIADSDKYWDKLWSKIDKAKKHIFIITYDVDNKAIANITLLKLIQAANRGVKVVFISEHINYYLKKSVETRLKESGVIILKPNSLFNIFKHVRENNLKKFFNRTHQKVTLVDEDVFVGSLNISSDYSGIHYGSYKFIDLNVYVKKTICLNKILSFFKGIIDDCLPEMTEEEKLDIENYFKNYELNSAENSQNFEAFEEFLEEKPPMKSEIQDNVYDLLDSANESIVVIQPYYTNLKRVEDILVRAAERGVKVKVITAEKRDQMAYKFLYNSDLFSRLLRHNVQVYEYLDKYLHMKLYYVDNKFANLGSFNNDVTSFVLNNEANYLIKKNAQNESFFKDLDSYIDNMHNNVRQVSINSYKNPFRLAISYWWYFFIWSMEYLVANRDHKYK
jgi:cardiolipin synthase